jgi:hypothetical protein
MDREVPTEVEVDRPGFVLDAGRERGGSRVAFDRCEARRMTAVLWATLGLDGSRPSFYHAA